MRWARAGGSDRVVSVIAVFQKFLASGGRIRAIKDAACCSVGRLRSLNEEQDVPIGHIRVMAIRDARYDVHDGASAGRGVLVGRGSRRRRCESLLSADIRTGGEIEDREGWRSDRGRLR